jgi:hypothetical protein
LYAGNSREAFWSFDEEMAQATESIYASARGKRPQLLAIYDIGDPPQGGCGEPITPRFLPGDDGISFRLVASFIDAVPGDDRNRNPSRWAALPIGTPLGHATIRAPIVLSKIVGPVIQMSPDTFAIHLDRDIYTPNRRDNDIWLLASHPGDDHFKSIVQQCCLHIQPNKEGFRQHLNFPDIPDQEVGVKSLKLEATSDAKLPVHYYVREGPVEIDGNTLAFSPLPPRSKLPLQITIVAWQWGTSQHPQVQTAEPVERTFLLTP